MSEKPTQEAMELAVLRHQNECFKSTIQPVLNEMKAATTAMTEVNGRLELGNLKFEQLEKDADEAKKKISKLEDKVSNVRIQVGKIIGYLLAGAGTGAAVVKMFFSGDSK